MDSFSFYSVFVKKATFSISLLIYHLFSPVKIPPGFYPAEKVIERLPSPG